MDNYLFVISHQVHAYVSFTFTIFYENKILLDDAHDMMLPLDVLNFVYLLSVLYLPWNFHQLPKLNRNCRQLPCPPFAPVAYATLQTAVLGAFPLTIGLAKRGDIYEAMPPPFASMALPARRLAVDGVGGWVN